jgi:hypothetical protein
MERLTGAQNGISPGVEVDQIRSRDLFGRHGGKRQQQRQQRTQDNPDGEVTVDPVSIAHCARSSDLTGVNLAAQR